MLSGKLITLFTLLAVGNAADFYSCLALVQSGSACLVWEDVTACLEDGGNYEEAGEIWLGQWSWVMEKCTPDTDKCSAYLGRLDRYLKPDLEDVDNQRLFVEVHAWLRTNCKDVGGVTEGVLSDLYNYMINFVHSG